MAGTQENRDRMSEVAGLGFRVDRATASLPQSTDGALFSISGGRILLTALIGEVTTVVQNQANNTKIVFNPSASGADQDLCAVLNIANDAVGELYSITGTVGDAMISDLLIVGGGLMHAPLVLSEGDIELNCAASNTGSVALTMFYLPIDTGAVVASA